MEHNRVDMEPPPPRRQPSWGVRGLVIVLILAGATYVVLKTDKFQDEGGVSGEQRQVVTEQVQNRLARAIEAYRNDGGKLGEWTDKQLLDALRTNLTASQILGYAPTGTILPDKILDGYQRPMQVILIPGPPPGMRITSAGRDGQFGTSDDIILRRVWSPPPASQPAKETEHEGSGIQRKSPPGREHVDTLPGRP